VAYWRAQECLRLDPGNAAAAQLVDRAKTQMATLPPKGALGDYESAVKAGDLESAEGILRGLLRLSPDDSDLKDRARTINLALAQTYALKERFGDARDCLTRGRAMYPQDKSWQGKLKLLDTIQGMAKGDRAAWIQLLG
jgi:predicted Zn-dependent protease